MVTEHNQGAGRSDRMHPFVYRAVLCFAVLLVLSIWGFFGGTGHTGLVLAVASLFIAIAIALPYVMARIGRRRGAMATSGDGLGRWLDENFETQSGSLPGRDAMMSVLLPVAAVCVGMMIFALTLHFAVPGGDEAPQSPAVAATGAAHPHG